MSANGKNKRGLYLPLVIVLTVLVLTLPLVYLTLTQKRGHDTLSALITAMPGKTNEAEVEVNPWALRVGERLNIAFLGFDRTSEAKKKQDIFRPDTIVIASFDLNSAEVKLLSIPRDSCVKIYNSDFYDKINHAYMHGYFQKTGEQDSHQSGLQITLKTIEQFLGGVPLHHYVSVDMDGAALIIDYIGGLHYDVEDTVYAEEFGRGRVLVKKGQQLLDGRKFMYYVRNRDILQGGEIGRTERQQKILIALFEALRRRGRLPELPAIYKTLEQAIETDLSLNQVKTLGLLALKIDPASITSHTFNGQKQLSYRDGQNLWFWIVDEEERVRIIKDVFGIKVWRNPAPDLPGPLYHQHQQLNEFEEDLTETIDSDLFLMEEEGLEDETVYDESINHEDSESHEVYEGVNENSYDPNEDITTEEEVYPGSQSSGQ